MADTRNCEQCGVVFTPRREHAPFCSVRCRAAWNRERMDISAVELSALQWSVTAMSDTVEVLCGAGVRDLRRAVATIGEAVWSVTIVDATLVRHHPEAYDAVMAGRSPAERPLIEKTLAGLRFVRNQIAVEVDVAELVAPSGADSGPVARWRWKSAPQPALGSLTPRAQEWEMRRYRAYQTELAGHTVGEVFNRAVAFLELTAARALEDVATSSAR